MFAKPPSPQPAATTQWTRPPMPQRARTLQDQAQQDLARLLRQLRAAPAETAVPRTPSAQAAPAPQPAPTPTASPVTATPSALRSLAPQPEPRELRATKTAISMVTAMSAVALALASLGFTVLSGDMARAQRALQAHDAHIEQIRSRQDALKKEVEGRLASMQVLLAEVKYPPSEFGQAQDLFRAGRYADAEAAYTAFLLRNPNSRMADVALNNAAVASAMRNNCGMAAAHVKKLKTQFPTSPFNAALASLVPDCLRYRAASRTLRSASSRP